MAWFKLKGVKPLDANGYHFEPGVPTEIPDDDTATLRKLRGDPRSKWVHPSFEEVSGA